jgi:hypothetical protein
MILAEQDPTIRGPLGPCLGFLCVAFVGAVLTIFASRQGKWRVPSPVPNLPRERNCQRSSACETRWLQGSERSL